MDWIDTTEAARILGVGRCRVWQFIRGGRLPASLHGGRWFVLRADLAAFRRQPPGRPRRAAKPALTNLIEAIRNRRAA